MSVVVNGVGSVSAKKNVIEDAIGTGTGTEIEIGIGIGIGIATVTGSVVVTVPKTVTRANIPATGPVGSSVMATRTQHL